ncbi:nickel-type superoxide dismutase maturation protease [Euzebya sp.]|uniref:nickel-type superoxide dismutase maturation protease n=1 Tax=Euzebya sp. TaxID=1971409 RepID=UPI003517A869
MRSTGVAGTVVAALAVATAVALVRTPRVAVEGPSMLPTLRPHDRLAVLPLPPVEGRLVVLRDPREPSRTIVKRVVAVAGGAVEVAGDNPDASTDSRHFGPVPAGLVRGRPVYRYHPPATAGWLWRA